LRHLAMVPDFTWKHGKVPHPLEGHTHFFEVDVYSKQGPIPKDFNVLLQKFGRETILGSGSAPWRIREMAVLLVNAMKGPNPSPKQIMYIAATLGHYIGDVGQPLHVTEDYDGKEAGIPGIHSFFETASVKVIPDAELLTTVKAYAEKLLPQI